MRLREFEHGWEVRVRWWFCLNPGREPKRGVPHARDRRLALNHNCWSRGRGGPLRAFGLAVGRLRGGPNDPAALMLLVGASNTNDCGVRVGDSNM